jgi:hypothetical protein
MIQVSWSVTDSASYLVEANSLEEAKRKIKVRFPTARIDGTFKLESEVIK